MNPTTSGIVVTDRGSKCWSPLTTWPNSRLTKVGHLPTPPEWKAFNPLIAVGDNQCATPLAANTFDKMRWEETRW